MFIFKSLSSLSSYGRQGSSLHPPNILDLPATLGSPHEMQHVPGFEIGGGQVSTMGPWVLKKWGAKFTLKNLQVSGEGGLTR